MPDEAEMVRVMVLHSGEDRDAALRRIGRSIGGYWTARGLFYGRRKDIGGSLSRKVRQAYLDWCRLKFAQAEARLRLAEQGCGEDACITDIHSSLADILVRIQQAERTAKGG